MTSNFKPNPASKESLNLLMNSIVNTSDEIWSSFNPEQTNLLIKVISEISSKSFQYGTLIANGIFYVDGEYHLYICGISFYKIIKEDGKYIIQTTSDNIRFGAAPSDTLEEQMEHMMSLYNILNSNNTEILFKKD